MHEQSFMPYILAFGWVSAMLLIGVLLRAKVSIFQKYLFPASLIGGLIGFVLISVGWVNIPHKTFTVFAIHFFTLNFISLGLTGNDAKAADGGSMKKTILKGSAWMGLTFSFILLTQSLIGFGFNALFNMFGTPIFTGLGGLVGNGFAQGPGQTVAIAAVWQNAFKIQDAISIGLTFAAVGFFVASLIGVPLAYWGVKKGLATHAPQDLPQDFRVGISEKNQGPSAGQLTTHSGNIDGFAFQLAMVMFVYFLTYFACGIMKGLLPPAVKPLAFGLMFLWGMIIAIFFRMILVKLGGGHLIDNNVQRRLTGTCVDFMIVATLMAVQVAAVWAHIGLLATICIVVAVFTFWIVLFFGRRSGEFAFERTVALFGYVTGTAASGLLLLRIVDPEFKTSVPTEMGMMNMFALATTLHLSFFIYILPKVGLPTYLGVVAGTAAGILILLFVFKLVNKKAW